MRNRKWKRISSGILAVCLVAALLLSNQSFGVLAEEETSQSSGKKATASESLTKKKSQKANGVVSSETAKNDDGDIELTSEEGIYSAEDSEVGGELDQEEESEEETDEEAIEVQADDLKISELINADVTLLKWKSEGGTANVTLDGIVYNITDDQSYQSTYEKVYDQMMAHTTSITDDLSEQTISKDTIWNVSNDISMSGNITVESGAHLIIIGTGTITKNGNYGIIVKGEAYLQGKVYFNGNQKDSALIQIPADSGSEKVFLADDFRLGNNGGNGITASGGKIYMVGGLIGTKDIDFEWYDGDNKKIDTKNYEKTLSYINKNLSSAEYNYINQITQRGGNARGINLQSGAELYMNDGVIAGNGNSAGGGINADNQAQIVMTGGIIIGNQTEFSGGALNISCSTTISGGMIAGNHSDQYAGGINMNGTTTLTGDAVIAFNSCDYNGGGILIAQKAICTMEENAAVVHNRAIGANKTSNSGKGGGFRVVGNLIINDGKINYNSGNGPLDSETVEQDIGGAISAQTDVLNSGEIRVATITLNGGEIAYNKANGRGGAIWMVCAANKYTATFELNGTNVHHNIAASNGGAIFLDARNGTLNANIKSGRLADNSAVDNGGGIYLLLTKDATALSVNIGEKNQQPTDLEITGNRSESIGGGLYVARTGNSTGTSNVNLYSGTLSGNQAQKGGAIGVSQGNLNVYGGKFENNTADINGGGAYVENGEVTVVDGNFQSNTAKNGGGAYIASGKLTVSEGSFYGNNAILNGGGAYVADGKVRIFGGSLEANTAKKDGGGLYVSSIDQAADVVIRSGSITDNTSGDSGAGLAVVGGENAKEDKVVLGLLKEHEGLNIDGANRTFTPFDYEDEIDNINHNHSSCPVLSNNTASGDGGGIYMQSSKAVLNVYCLKEEGNTSGKNTNGNGVMMAGGQMVIGDEKHNDNTAWGNTVINSPMLVEGGNVDIWGSMNNPLFAKNILVDIENGAGEFEDHRTQATDRTRYKVHYFENFTAGDAQKPSGIYVANQYDYDVDVPALGTIFTHDGWNILGWATEADKDKGNITYQIGTNIGDKNDHTAWGNDNTEALVLYAIWERNVYTVKFNPNANNYGGPQAMADQTFSYGVTQKLNPNEYKVTGKQFAGWNTKADGSGTSYEADYNESKMTLTNRATVELFAQWVDCTHKDGGTLSYTKDAQNDSIIESCSCEGHTATIRLIGRNTYHDGEAHPAEKVITGTLLAENPKVKYKFSSTEDGTFQDMEEGEPTDVGYYEASITVGDKTVTVKYRIESAATKVTAKAECTDGQQFGTFNGKAECSVAKDDAFTVLYTIQKLDDTYYSNEPSLVLSQDLPEGTTIIMQANGSYWYNNEPSGTKITLSSFTKMGGSEKFQYQFSARQEYRFIFDFSKVKGEMLSGDLETKIMYEHNSSSANDPVSASVTIKLGGEGTFALSGTADNLQITAPESSEFHRWYYKNLVLTVTANDEKQFPADARLVVKDKDKTYTYRKNNRNVFVIPIEWNPSETVNMTLESNLLSQAEQEYSANVMLSVGDKAENFSDQPQAVEYENKAQLNNVSLKVSKDVAPSLRIVGTKKVLKKTDKLNLTITQKETTGCSVHAVIQQKKGKNYEGKFLDTEVTTEGNNEFSLSGIQEAGSYRLLITVTKDNRELLSVPYYFIVQ